MWSFNLSCVSAESFTPDTSWEVLLTSIYSKEHGLQIIFKAVEPFLQMKLEMEVQNRKKKSRGGAVKSRSSLHPTVAQGNAMEEDLFPTQLRCQSPL